MTAGSSREATVPTSSMRLGPPIPASFTAAISSA
jgi:hypothetical protein